jgi:hypothetical protein
MKFDLETLEEAISDGTIGFCISCGADHFGVEPDARGYECEECGKRKVCGAEEILMMGLVDEDDEEDYDD